MFDEASCVNGLDLIDIDTGEQAVDILLYDFSGNVIEWLVVPGAGGNSVQHVDVDTCGVWMMMVDIYGSGAIDNVDICPGGGDEVCDGVDNDGDGEIDEGTSNTTAWEWSAWGGGGNSAGNWQFTWAEYSPAAETLSVDMTIADAANVVGGGMTFVVSDGPNPKGHGNLAILYYDATGPEPVMTVYAYNGLSSFTSYYDGSDAGGTQPPDRIASSLLDDSWVISAETLDDGTATTYRFSIDVSAINAHLPLYTGAWDWDGMQFGPQFGLWMHGMGNLSTSYTDGWLTDWAYGADSWNDRGYEWAWTVDVCVP